MKLTTLIFTLGFGLFTCGLQAATTDNAEIPTETSTPNPPATATVVDFEQSFKTGVTKYQEKKYDEARLSLEEALKQNPQSVQTLVNLALAQYQLGKKGLAVALLRKARALDPDFSTPQAALRFIESQLDVKEIPHEIQLWETIRTHFVVPFSMTAFLALTALTFFATGWLFVIYFGKRRRALRENLTLPAFPLIPSLITLIFIATLGLTFLKAWDYGIPRGTVINDKVTVLSAPAENSPALFDLYSGLDVVLNATDNDWVQVTYPGAMTGWVQKNAIFQTSGRSLW